MINMKLFLQVFSLYVYVDKHLLVFLLPCFVELRALIDVHKSLPNLHWFCIPI